MPNKIIRRKDTGAEHSVDEAAFRKHYPDVAYEVIGEESGDAFVLTGVPMQRAARRAVRAKGKAKGKAAPAQPLARIPAEPAHPKPSEVLSPPAEEG